MTQRRLPAGFNTADENDIIQKGPGDIWVTRSPAELGIPATGVSYAPAVPVDWTDPDPVNVASALDALRALSDTKFAEYHFQTVSPVNPGNRIPLTLGEQQGGFTVSGGDTVTCPGGVNARHLALMVGSFSSASAANPTTMTVALTHAGQPGFVATRHSTNVSEGLQITLIGVFGTTIAIEPDGSALSAFGRLFVLKLI